MGYILGTGFETGDKTYLIPTGWGDWCNLSSGGKTGSYCLYVREYYGLYSIQIPFNDDASASEIWFSVYINNTALTSVSPIGFKLIDGTVIGLVNSNGYYSFYRNGTMVYESSEPVIYNTWHNIQGHIIVSSGSDGLFEFSVEGGSYQVYNGVTQPSTSNLIYRFYFSPHFGYMDDVAVSNSGLTGDIRFSIMKPTSDESVTWDRSTGSTNYTLVDELMPVDTDYVSSGSDGYKDYYGLEPFSTSPYIYPVFTTQYTRAKKEYADDTKMKTLAKLNTDEDISAETALSTTFYTYRRTLDLAPDGGAWTNDKLNNLQIGIQSVIP